MGSAGSPGDTVRRLHLAASTHEYRAYQGGNASVRVKHRTLRTSPRGGRLTGCLGKGFGSHHMNRMVLLPIAVVVLVGTVIYRVRALERPNREVSPIYEVAIPSGYREWQVIAVDNLLVAGKTDQLRAQLGNSIAMKAFKDKTLPFPDGAIIAAIHWTRVASGDNDKVLGGPFPGAESFVIGSTVNVQFMVK